MIMDNLITIPLLTITSHDQCVDYCLSDWTVLFSFHTSIIKTHWLKCKYIGWVFSSSSCIKVTSYECICSLLKLSWVQSLWFTSIWLVAVSLHICIKWVEVTGHSYSKIIIIRAEINTISANLVGNISHLAPKKGILQSYWDKSCVNSSKFWSHAVLQLIIVHTCKREHACKTTGNGIMNRAMLSNVGERERIHLLVVSNSTT